MPTIWLKFNGMLLTKLRVVDDIEDKIKVPVEGSDGSAAGKPPIYYPPLNSDGIAVAAYSTNSAAGSITLNYTLDGVDVPSKSIVVFEGINEASSPPSLEDIVEMMAPKIKEVLK